MKKNIIHIDMDPVMEAVYYSIYDMISLSMWITVDFVIQQPVLAAVKWVVKDSVWESISVYNED